MSVVKEHYNAELRQWFPGPRPRSRADSPLIMPDLPDYVSPVTGKVVSGRKQRREDLKRTGSRPWEGMDSEKREAARWQADQETKHDRRLEETVRREYHQLSPEKRRILEGR